MYTMHQQPIINSCSQYYKFLQSCRLSSDSLDFKLTPVSDISPFARCFWIFGMHLLGKSDELDCISLELSRALYSSLKDAHIYHKRCSTLYSKSFRQLFTFTLSSLSILDKIDNYDLLPLVQEQLSIDVTLQISQFDCLMGKASCGL